MRDGSQRGGRAGTGSPASRGRPQRCMSRRMCKRRRQWAAGQSRARSRRVTSRRSVAVQGWSRRKRHTVPRPIPAARQYLQASGVGGGVAASLLAWIPSRLRSVGSVRPCRSGLPACPGHQSITFEHRPTPDTNQRLHIPISRPRSGRVRWKVSRADAALGFLTLTGRAVFTSSFFATWGHDTGRVLESR